MASGKRPQNPSPFLSLSIIQGLILDWLLRGKASWLTPAIVLNDWRVGT